VARVGERRRSPPGQEVRRRVGLGGRADIAALAVGDHEQPALAREPGHALGRRQAVMPGLLEERQLRLDRHRVLRDGLDDARAEALERASEAGGTVAHAAKDLRREKLGSWVEPDAQHASALRRQPLETLSEAARHARQATARTPRGAGRGSAHATAARSSVRG